MSLLARCVAGVAFAAIGAASASADMVRVVGPAVVSDGTGNSTLPTSAIDPRDATSRALVFGDPLCQVEPDDLRPGAPARITGADEATDPTMVRLQAIGGGALRVGTGDGPRIGDPGFIGGPPLADLAPVRISAARGAAAQPVPLPAAGLSGGVLLGISAIIRRIRRLRRG